MEADFRHLLKCCFFPNLPTQSWVNWRNFPNSPFSIIEISEKKEKWQFFGSEWQISIIVEDQIRLWRLYFCTWINRRGDTAIGYFRVVSPKNISSNQLLIYFFSKNVTFTKFLPKMSEKSQHFPHCVTEIFSFYFWKNFVKTT